MSKADAECSFRTMGCCFTETSTPCRCETSGCKNFACLQCCFLVRGISLSEDGKPLRLDGTVDPFLSSVPILCESCTRVKDPPAIKKYYKHLNVLKILRRKLAKEKTKQAQEKAKQAKEAAPESVVSVWYRVLVQVSMIIFLSLSFFLSLCIAMLMSNSHWLPRRKRYWAVPVVSASLI